MELYQFPTTVRKKFKEHFKHDPPSRLTIYRLQCEFQRTGSVANCIKGVSGPRVTKRTDDNINQIRKFMKTVQYPSMRRVTLTFNMSQHTAQRILHRDLGMYPYVIQRVQKLKPQDKVKKLDIVQ